MPGQFPPSIIVGVIVSIFSLAWGSSRAFFIERTRDEADPDPALNMVLMWVFPCMVLIALNSMTMWTLTGGILGKALFLTWQNVISGPWVFLAMIFLFVVNLIVLTLVAQEISQKVSEETPSEGREEEEKKTSEIPAVELMIEEELVTKMTGQEGAQENPTKGAEAEDAKGLINNTTDQEKAKEDSRERTDEPGKTQKRTDSAKRETGEEGNKEDSTKLPNMQEAGKQTEEADAEMNSREASSPQEATEASTKKPEMASRPFFVFKAALTAMWLPAVVGDKKNLFIAASLSTLITKNVMLLVSGVFAYFFQDKMNPHPFVFWSRMGKR